TNEEGARLPLRPFEVKLTVVPDHSTASKKPEEWCSEVVVRPVATQYALLSLLHALDKSEKIVRLADRLLEFFARNDLQTPFLLQPMWWTEGASFRLRDPTFDYVVWSDTALFYVALDRAMEELDETDKDFAVNGSVSRKYLGEVIKGGPRMSKADVLGEVLIEADPAKVLKPERRLDAALFLEGLLESALKTDDSP
ncbi:MAG: hypothetical protein BLM47_14325, partial [Candidatus Reconcilbacillus cellulovorans]